MQKTDPPVFYKRHVFEHEDPKFAGEFAVDFVAKPFEEVDPKLPQRTIYFKDQEFANLSSSDDKPMVVVLHGLAGGPNEVYLRCVLKPLVDAGWEGCVVVNRGCANTKITTSVLYNARATWDIRQTIRFLRKTFPNRPLFGLAFSLGANIMVNVRKSDGPSFAVSCSNPRLCSTSLKKVSTVS